MRETIAEATDLLNRVVQVSPEVKSTAKNLAQKIVEESMNFDLTEAQLLTE